MQNLQEIFGLKKGIQTGIGFGTGGAAGTIATGIGKVVSPALDPAQQLLSKAGVKLTPGQIGGDTTKAVEEFGARFPIMGHFIRSAEQKTTESFNIATINQALEPIGIKVPSDVKAGHEAISFMKDTLSKAYNDTYSKSTLAVTPQVNLDLIPLIQKAATLPDTQLQQFNTIIQDKFLKPLLKSGGISGPAVKDLDSDINSLAQSYITSSTSGERNLGIVLKDLRALVKSSIAQQNPKIAGKISDLDAAYAMATRVENAASRKIDTKGVFSPKDLLSAVKKGDDSVRDRNFAAGDALFQTWAEAADEVIPTGLKKSYLIGAEEIGGAGTLLATGTVAQAIPPLAAGAAVAKGLYSDLGIDIANYLASTPPGAARQTFNSILQGASGAPPAAAAEDLFPQ